MELYVNSTWTAPARNPPLAAARAWSQYRTPASIYTMGGTAEEADTKLISALRELRLMPQTAIKEDER